MRKLACKGLVEVITDFLDGALSRRDRRRFEAHLEICDGCTTYMDQMRRTIRATGRLTEDQIAPEMKARLLVAFADWKRSAPA